MATVTELVVTGIIIPVAASRGLVCAVSFDDNGSLERDCNGTLHDLTLETHRKRVVTISCTDIRAPDMGAKWRGALATVTVVSHLLGDGPVTMNMMLSDYEPSRDEFPAKTAWVMTFREV